MFRAQVPPRPLDYALENFIRILEERFGAPAALEAQTREFIALLNEEVGHPVRILTRKRFTKAAERALSRLLASKR